MKIDARAKEKSRELWLKTGSYDRVLRALRKTGGQSHEGTPSHAEIQAWASDKEDGSPETRKMRGVWEACHQAVQPEEEASSHGSAMPKMPQQASHQKFREENPGYKKKEQKRYYKRHRETLLRKQRTRTKSLRTYIHPVTCPVCGEHGCLEAAARLWKNTGHIIGPYYTVRRHSPSHYCYLGRQPSLDNKLPANLICSCPRCSPKREQEKKRRRPRGRKAKKGARLSR